MPWLSKVRASPQAQATTLDFKVWHDTSSHHEPPHPQSEMASQIRPSQITTSPSVTTRYHTALHRRSTNNRIAVMKRKVTHHHTTKCNNTTSHPTTQHLATRIPVCHRAAILHLASHWCVTNDLTPHYTSSVHMCQHTTSQHQESPHYFTN